MVIHLVIKAGSKVKASLFYFSTKPTCASQNSRSLDIFFSVVDSVRSKIVEQPPVEASLFSLSFFSF